MSLAQDLVGRESEPIHHAWTPTDPMLYAIAVGAGSGDPLKEREFTTELSDAGQKVLPGFANILLRGARFDLGSFDPASIVHADQSFRLERPLPLEGACTTRTVVVGVEAKRSGCLVQFAAEARSDSDGAILADARYTFFLRGVTGYTDGALRAAEWVEPTDAAHTVGIRTREEAALLYRLTGDRNPLHTEPAVATRAGFDRPIVHGMYLYGQVARVLLHEVCGSDPARFRSMSARFSAPVVPGGEVSLRIWTADGTSRFQLRSDDRVVLDRGLVEFTEPETIFRDREVRA